MTATYPQDRSHAIDMATHSRRTVITGLGVLSPIGSDPVAFWGALRAGASGIRTVRAVEPSVLSCRIAGEIPDFSPKTLIDKSYRKPLNAMSRPVQFGVVAAQLAVQNAGLVKGTVPPERFGVVFASVMNETEIDDLTGLSVACSAGFGRPVDMAAWGRVGVPQMPPTWMLKYLPNMPACHATIMHDAQGPSNSLTPSDLAGVAAVGEALHVIRRGTADVMLAGGCESKITPVTLARLDTFAPLTREYEHPESAVRPFDRDASGTCLGEGAAVFTLEELAHAQKREVPILGEIVGFASGVDRGMTGAGLARIIRTALTNAGIQPGDIDHVNAHGVGVPELDRFEARGIAAVFDRDVPVFAPLSRFGNMGAASGTMELACSVLALQHGVLPGTLNHTVPDDDCPITVHTGAPRPVTKPYAIKITVTDLGQCGAVVIKRWET
ncbi:3-oxoacyl-acp synthase : 3-oxoacyl-(Acyl carrier protein) synthase OS=Planctomyces maris DSM 8797 GN=PM8797T_28459 PE=3 SV=1: ketoacyl-synt: Ketoacyl-synt_C [Gemmata massiliana]|uniref:Ketosynthase family 3 (KS3) domain-containing protein n=1 Tax=Gemmata massiliana TaxID=1210884 RepID=A0A6P2CYA7_9BACT|nr:beta-ketoacyl-[acyl-carrier-protein] synthase family protein [Gemmata massiliana]VTR92180.1 3-oxoacyl-acp synthase : 3-oxoacyl-(Acyl carrier protein) synthase OS=Planctomyces maris DSM 8797 GN=PM8797T_28459 PE=3 SV=1: ketoacyl-synt: Ketoacyl-synt_C [Gemmata massiliana]